MDVWRITVATLRRWYIFLPLLALTLGAVHVVGQGVQPEYEVSATALITPGRAPAEVPNPYGGSTQANEAVAIVLNSVETRAHVEAQGLVPTYEVSTQARTTIMNLSVRGPNSDQTVATAHYVIELAVRELSDRQSAGGLPPASQYGLDILADPAIVAVAYDGKLQVQAVTGLLGASLSLLVALLFDDIVGLYRRRRDRRRAQSTAQDSDAPVAGPAEWAEGPAAASEHSTPVRIPRDRDPAHA